MIPNLLQILFLFAIPACILFFEARYALIRKISPVVMCYGLGILCGHLPFLGLSNSITNTVIEATVAIAIPLLLFPSDFTGFLRLAPATAKSFVAAIVSVCVVSALGVQVFGDSVPDSWMVSAMLVGVYTGGTPNLTAIAIGLDVPEETFIVVNAADILLCSIYLLVLISIAKPVLAKWLRPFDGHDQADVPEGDGGASAKPRVSAKPGHVIAGILLAGICLGVSAGVSLLLTGTLSPAAMILCITTLAIALSFHRTVRDLRGTYEFGQFLMLVFCFAIGTLANVNDMIAAFSGILAYCAFVLIGSILLHVILAKIANVDVDTVIITSTAAVLGPPFIGPVANVLKNRSLIVGGMTASVIGLAIGNYLGFAIGSLLRP